MGKTIYLVKLIAHAHFITCDAQSLLPTTAGTRVLASRKNKVNIIASPAPVHYFYRFGSVLLIWAM